MNRDDTPPDDDDLPEGWKASSWSRTRDGFDLTVYKHEPPVDADALPERVRERLMPMFEQRRFSWDVRGDGVSLNGPAPRLAIAIAKAEAAVDDLVQPEDSAKSEES